MSGESLTETAESDPAAPQRQPFRFNADAPAFKPSRAILPPALQPETVAHEDTMSVASSQSEMHTASSHHDHDDDYDDDLDHFEGLLDPQPTSSGSAPHQIVLPNALNADDVGRVFMRQLGDRLDDYAESHSSSEPDLTAEELDWLESQCTAKDNPPGYFW